MHAKSSPLSVLTFLAALLVASCANAAPHYRDISFRDFVVDGPTLARKLAAVRLVGMYTRQGEEAVLYENQEALMMARYGPAALTPPPTIPLLTDQASHNFREMQYTCNSQQAYGSPECVMVVAGIVTMCTVTNAFGAETDSPCIEVEDGDDGATGLPPAPITQSTPSAPAPAITPVPAVPAPQQAPAVAATASQQPFDPDSPVVEQKVRACIQSPEMANEDDVYRKCLSRVRAAATANPSK